MCLGAKAVVDKKKTKLSSVELYFAWPVSELEWHKRHQPQVQSGDQLKPSHDGQVDQSRGEQAQTQCEEQPQSVLHVYGIPASMHSDVIHNYFSNKRNGGGPIDRMDRSDSVTCMHFKQAQGVHI
jgi:hypothetical protein